jgi:transposase
MVAMMQSPKPRQISFDTPVVAAPATRARELLRSISELVDLQFVREMARPYFAECGRPCIDPVLMLKMMLVGYLFGIESDRRLVDECADRLSFREFLGCLADEPMPVHSSFTHWRQRLGPEFFREVLHQIVRQCEGHGMKLSGARCVDGTRVKAQASRGGPKVEVPKDADVDEYLDEYFACDIPPGPPPEGESIPINTHDPDARLQARKGERAEFRYDGSLCSDPESGLVTDATAKPREEASTALDHICHDPGQVNEFVADGLYDDATTLAALQERGVRCYVPEPAEPAGSGLSKRHFSYDRQRNLYICPMGKELKWSRYHRQRRANFYTAKVSDCTHCPLKCRCTSAQRRSVSRLELQYARDATVRAGPRYEYLQGRRTINEHLNLLGKRDHALSRARGLGLAAMRIQAALVGAAIDLKKLVRHVSLPPACAFASIAHAFVPPVCASRLWFGLRGARAGLTRALRAIPTNLSIMRTILPGHTIQPKPAPNRGF